MGHRRTLRRLPGGPTRHVVRITKLFGISALICPPRSAGGQAHNLREITPRWPAAASARSQGNRTALTFGRVGRVTTSCANAIVPNAKTAKNARTTVFIINSSSRRCFGSPFARTFRCGADLHAPGSVLLLLHRLVGNLDIDGQAILAHPVRILRHLKFLFNLIQ